MEQKEKVNETNKLLVFLSDNAHWIAAIFLILGFIIASIDSKGVLNGKSFHQLTIAPIFMLTGYSLFIYVIVKKLKA